MNRKYSQSKKSISTYIIALVLSLWAVSLAGCAGSGEDKAQELTLNSKLKPDPAFIELHFDASDYLNPDLGGRPSPLVVRFYQLKSADVFNNADFFGLYENDISILGSDIRYREEMKVTPGEHRVLTREAESGSRFLGVFAAYRDLEIAHWRTTKALPVNASSQILVRLHKTAVTIEFIGNRQHDTFIR